MGEYSITPRQHIERVIDWPLGNQTRAASLFDGSVIDARRTFLFFTKVVTVFDFGHSR
jgi:hypothetical protein